MPRGEGDGRQQDQRGQGAGDQERGRREDSNVSLLLDVNPLVRYPLLVFNMILWCVGVGMMTAAIYSWIEGRDVYGDSQVLRQHSLSALLLLNVEVAIFLLGFTLFSISFCGCVGSLRENTVLLRIYSFTIDSIIVANFAAGVIIFFLPGTWEGGGGAESKKETLSEVCQSKCRFIAYAVVRLVCVDIEEVMGLRSMTWCCVAT